MVVFVGEIVCEILLFIFESIYQILCDFNNFL